MLKMNLLLSRAVQIKLWAGVIDVVDVFEATVGAAAVHFRLQPAQSSGFCQEPKHVDRMLLIIRPGTSI